MQICDLSSVPNTLGKAGLRAGTMLWIAHKTVNSHGVGENAGFRYVHHPKGEGWMNRMLEGGLKSKKNDDT